MPKDTIEKAIKKGTGDVDGVNFEEILYEGYGNDGVAIMCEVLTDNRNRTAGELRRIFDSRGGSLGASGCVAWMFSKKGLFAISAGDVDEETLMEVALEAGADDFERQGESFEITCSVDTFESVKQALKDKELPTQVAELSQVPSNYISLDEEAARKILRLMEALEDQEDVQNVYANFDISQEIIGKLEAE